MGRWISTDRSLDRSSAGMMSPDAAVGNPWLARGGLLFVALESGVACLSFAGQTARREAVDIQTIPSADALTSDQTYKCGFIAVSRDGRMLALLLRSAPYVVVYNTATWTPYAAPATLPAAKPSGVAFSPDGSLLAVTHASSPYLTIYNTGDWSKLDNPATLPGGTGLGCEFSPDGTKLAVGVTASPYLLVYTVSDWSVAYTATELSAAVYTATWSPNGQYLAVATGTTLRVYTVSSWASNVQSLAAGRRTCVWAADSARLYAGNSSVIGYTTVGVWDSNALYSSAGSTHFPVAVSPDGTMIAFVVNTSQAVGVVRISDGTLLSTPSVFAASAKAGFWFRFPRP